MSFDDEIETGWDENEEMYYAFCSTCGTEVFANVPEDAHEEGVNHLNNGHVWSFDLEDSA